MSALLAYNTQYIRCGWIPSFATALFSPSMRFTLEPSSVSRFVRRGTQTPARPAAENAGIQTDSISCTHSQTQTAVLCTHSQTQTTVSCTDGQTQTAVTCTDSQTQTAVTCADGQTQTAVYCKEAEMQTELIDTESQAGNNQSYSIHSQVIINLLQTVMNSLGTPKTLVLDEVSYYI